MSIKERARAFKDKCKDIWRDHKGEIIACGMAIAGIVGVCWISSKLSHRDEDDCEEIEQDAGITSKRIDFLGSAKAEDDSSTRGWCDELYRENWDKVQAFASTLQLQKDESYILDDSQRYYNEPWYTGRRDGHPIVSHLVDGDGVYPPDEPDYLNTGTVTNDGEEDPE